jgi:LacI family kdg operon repressor
VVINALGAREDWLRSGDDDALSVVMVDRSIDGLSADMVGLDNADAVQQGVHHLVRCGFDELYFVVQPFERVRPRRMREAAFHEAVQIQQHIYGSTVVLDLDDATASADTLAKLDRHLDQAARCTCRHIAFFAANAPVALAIALHLNARYGARWQERVALMSIDDPEWVDLTDITTIRAAGNAPIFESNRSSQTRAMQTRQ